MPAKFKRSLLYNLIIALFILMPSLSVIAQDDDLKEHAKIYRDKGYEAQRMGDLDSAMSYYQKAIELDPVYVAAYNDLGVIYESKGFTDRAEESYLKCLKIDPYYRGAYFNLASLYEDKGELRKAAYYWKKRIQIGDPNDPWTKKAKEHLQNIGMLIEDIGKQLKQQETVDLIKSLSPEKDSLEMKTPEVIATQQGKKARLLLNNAEKSYDKGDYAAALKDAVTAEYLDPSNSEEIEKFIEKIREKLGAYIQ